MCREEYLSSLVALLKQLPKANLDLLFYILRFCNKLRYDAIIGAPFFQLVDHSSVNTNTNPSTANRQSRPR